MSNIQTGAERMPHDLSHLGFLAGQIGRLITISTTPVIAGDSFEMDAVGALRLSPLRRGLAIDSTVDIFTFYVPHRHVYGEQCIKFMKDGVTATVRAHRGGAQEPAISTLPVRGHGHEGWGCLLRAQCPLDTASKRTPSPSLEGNPWTQSLGGHPRGDTPQMELGRVTLRRAGE